MPIECKPPGQVALEFAAGLAFGYYAVARGGLAAVFLLSAAGLAYEVPRVATALAAGDVKTVVANAFNDGAVAQRAELAELNKTLQSELEKKGLTFNTAETQSFRDMLAKAGFYKEWREKLGDEVWSLLEKQVGKLG